jgi:hypothetical protein
LATCACHEVHDRLLGRPITPTRQLLRHVLSSLFARPTITTPHASFGEADHIMIVWARGVRRMSSLVMYRDGEPFPGVIGRTSDESRPAWPTPPPAGRVELAAANRGSVGDVFITRNNDRGLRRHGTLRRHDPRRLCRLLADPSRTTSMLHAEAPPQRGLHGVSATAKAFIRFRAGTPESPSFASRCTLTASSWVVAVLLTVVRHHLSQNRSPLLRPLLSRLQMIKRGRPWTVR